MSSAKGSGIGRNIEAYSEVEQRPSATRLKHIHTTWCWDQKDYATMSRVGF